MNLSPSHLTNSLHRLMSHTLLTTSICTPYISDTCTFTTAGPVESRQTSCTVTVNNPSDLGMTLTKMDTLV